MPNSEVFALILRKNYSTRVYEKSLRYLVKINDFIHCIADAKCCKKVSHPWEKWWNLILLLWLNAMSLQSSVACLILLGADSQHFGYIPGKQQRWSQSSFYVAWSSINDARGKVDVISLHLRNSADIFLSAVHQENPFLFKVFFHRNCCHTRPALIFRIYTHNPLLSNT